MKKLGMLMLGLAGLAVASCSQEDVVAPAADGYSVTIKLPGDLGTRAEYGEGYIARELLYAVYEVDASGNRLSAVTTGETTFPKDALETTVNFNLANGKYYAIAFFAESYWARYDGVYTFDNASATIKVDYSKMKYEYNNEDGYDCFFKLYNTGMIGDAATSPNVSIYLTRPVAQINWGTSDYEADAITDSNSFGPNAKGQLETIFTTEAYTTFDFFTRNVSDPETITVGTLPFAAPTEASFPVEPSTYDYVAMQYVLAPVESTIYDLNLTVQTNSTANGSYSDVVIVNNAPVQANYRTNIYGALLTDNLSVTVVKDPIWGDPDYDIDLSVWDGRTVKTPALVNGKYTIHEAAELAGLAQLSQTEDFDGENIVLGADINMGGYPLPAIGSSVFTINQKGAANNDYVANTEGTSFKGNFDGQGHTISNFTITGSATANAVFVNAVDGGTFKNVNFSGATINGGEANQAAIVGVLTNGGTVEGVNISGTVSGNTYVAGVVGSILYDGTISNCANSATITATGDNVGGIAGSALYTRSDEESMNITGCSNTGNVSGVAKVGGIVGIGAVNVTNCSNTGAITGSTALTYSSGGIVGELRNGGSITGCTNSGTVTQTSTDANKAWGAGGIVGFVRYYLVDGNYSAFTEFVVENNVNYANVTGVTGVGGICGVWYNGGSCSENFNYASKLTCTAQFVGGIIGNQTWSEAAGNNPADFNAPATLAIADNSTSTTLDNISGNLKDLVAYLNVKNKVTGFDTNITGVAQKFPE